VSALRLSRARLTTAVVIGSVAWPSVAFAVTEPPSPLPAEKASAQRDWRTLDTRSAARPASSVQPVAPAPKSGDTPVDYPGASRAPEYTAPTTIQVVRPERTIVRDVDEALPVVLSSAALLIAVGGSALLLTATVRRRRPSSSH
jgi:hypothetical protein